MYDLILLSVGFLAGHYFGSKRSRGTLLASLALTFLVAWAVVTFGQWRLAPQPSWRHP